MRAKAEIEETARGATGIDRRHRAALPGQPQQSIAGRIKELVDAGELEGIADVNDDVGRTASTDLVIKLKRDANANVVLNNLYKRTPLQTNFAVNMVALVDGVPRTLNLVQALAAYIDHQVEVITRRSRVPARQGPRAGPTSSRASSRPSTSSTRSSPLIRASDDRAAARSGLMAEPFEFTEVQAEHILDMRLGQLTRLARIDLEEELDEAARAPSPSSRPSSPTTAACGRSSRTSWARSRSEFATPRVAADHLRQRRPRHRGPHRRRGARRHHDRKGYIKTVAADAFRTQGRGGRGVAGAKLKDDGLRQPHHPHDRPTPTCCSSPTGARCTA